GTAQGPKWCAQAAMQQPGGKMDWLVALKDYVPLFQTLVWSLLIVGCLIVFRKELRQLLTLLYGRVRDGSSLEIVGIFKIGEGLRDLKRVEQSIDERVPREHQD